MIIWSGFGIIVLVFGAAGLFGFPLLLSEMTGEENLAAAYPWFELPGLVLAGLLCLITGRFLNRVRATGHVDRETGEEIYAKGNHTFFFIRVEHWFYIFTGVGILFFIQRVF